MRVLVYPHTMEIGGSQLNAVDLAAAVRDRGHQVVVYSAPGPLVARVREHGLVHVARRESRLSPGPGTARHLRGVVRDRGIEVVHAWEWPPILEGYAATGPGTGAALVGSVMSMGVADFVPRRVSLTVGTPQLAEEVARRRPGPTTLLEPPVDLVENRPGPGAADFGRAFPAPAGTEQVVIVSRLARELKLEGILTAVEAVARLAGSRPVRLVVVGDGPASHAVAAAAREANHRAGREVVVLTGELADPRGAYLSADVCLGMGGSALRALAHAAPLVVQGEGGFFEVCDPRSAPRFLSGGWYGVDERGPEDAVQRLAKTLDDLLGDPGRRAALGAFGRGLVEERYGLEAAAATLEQRYAEARAVRPSAPGWAAGGLAAAPALVSYKVRRRAQRRRGTRAQDDFNARPR